MYIRKTAMDKFYPVVVLVSDSSDESSTTLERRVGYLLKNPDHYAISFSFKKRLVNAKRVLKWLSSILNDQKSMNIFNFTNIVNGP